MSDKPVMRVERQCFETLEDVMEAIKASGFWPTTYISTPSPELPLHWHDDDVEGYLLKGETYVLNEKGERVDLGPGDKLVIPAGALHAEGKVTDEIVYVVSTKSCEPFNYIFRMLDPDTYPTVQQLELDPVFAGELMAAMQAAQEAIAARP